MTEPLERDNVIDLLNRLGSDQDEEVLDAARQVHAQITAAGMSWEELLIPDVPEEDDEDDVDELEDQETADEIPETQGDASEKNADSLALITELLAKPGISEDMRGELESYKSDIAEGEFLEADRRYLRAVYERLSKRR